MNFQQAAKVLRDELEEKGYTTRLDTGHKHPRLYIESDGSELFTILSTTANYDQANLLNIKRQDITRDVLSRLPLPDPVSKVDKKESDTEPVEPELNGEIKSIRVYPIKVYLRGTRGRPVLVVQVPSEVVPGPDKSCVEVFLTMQEPKRLGLVFKPTGIPPSKTVSTKYTAYVFTKDNCPFEYADTMPPKEYKSHRAATLCARFLGDALVCDKPIPESILSRQPTTKKVSYGSVGNSKYTLKDGSDLRTMVNEWVDWANQQGHDPKLSILDNYLQIEVSEKVTRSL